MPRKLPSNVSVQAVHDFLKIFIAESDSDDDILPKNGAFSPFDGFSRIYPQHTNLQDGGTSLDGITRAGVNKMVGRLYQEGMRKPSRNGNPGDLNMVDAHKLARHFLKLRWRSPDQAADLMVLQQAWNEMQPQQVVESLRVLRLLCQWRPGPAGRGGDRGSRRSAFEEMEDNGHNVRRKRSDGSAQRISKTWIETEDDADDLSDRSTVVGSDISLRSPNTNRPDSVSCSLAPRSNADLRASGWASALAATPYAGSLGGSVGSGVVSSLAGSASVNSRLSSQGLLLQLAQQVRHASAASAPQQQQKQHDSKGPQGPMTAAQYLVSPSALHLQPPAAWARQQQPPPSSSFASTLLSHAPASSAPASSTSPAPDKTAAHETAMRAQQQQRCQGGGGGLTLPPLAISTALPRLAQVLEQAFA